MKALVEMHKGSISVKSEYENGSEFTVELPLEVLYEAGEYSSSALSREPRIEKLKIEYSDIYAHEN